MSRLLVRSKIEEIEFILMDYWWLKTNQAFISINNPIKVMFNGEEMKLEEVERENIIDHEIISEELREEEYYYFVLDNGYKIIVSLLDEDYDCPEAMSVDYYSGKTIIIN